MFVHSAFQGRDAVAAAEFTQSGKVLFNQHLCKGNSTLLTAGEEQGRVNGFIKVNLYYIISLVCITQPFDLNILSFVRSALLFISGYLDSR